MCAGGLKNFRMERGGAALAFENLELDKVVAEIINKTFVFFWDTLT